MNWTRPKDLKAQLVRLWDRGELLRDAVTGQQRFPLRLTLKLPGSADITDRFDATRSWAAELGSVTHVRIEWQLLRHRVQGAQRLPAQAWVDSVDDALAWVGKRHEHQRFLALLDRTRQRHSTLLPWLQRRPLQALELADDWPRLLAVVGWCLHHPRPGIYLRQVDLPGIHTKFIETHRAVLTELLDLALPANAVNAGKTGVNQFAGRYGFLDKPARVRFRVLDPRLHLLPELEGADITLDASSFGRLRIGTRRVFITENEINFLSFPPADHSIVIFGAGYGWDALASSHWLRECTLHYWGDIDTHGFAILDQLRSTFPHVESWLMDQSTLDAHRAVWGTEEKPTHAELTRLTAAERRLYDALRDNRIRPHLRLEQEHLGYGWIQAQLAALIQTGSTTPPQNRS